MADIFTEALHKANANAGIISGQMGFDETAEVLEKGKRASIGEIRDWRGGKFQKTADGWKPVPQRHSKASLKETEIENLKNGTITENELNGLPDGTEIHIDSNGSYFRKDSEGWIYGNSVLGSENRTDAKGMVDFIETRMKSDGWDASKSDGRFGLKQVLIPGEEKKDSKNGFLDKDGKVTWDKSSAFTDENTWEGKLWKNVQRFQKLQDPSIADIEIKEKDSSKPTSGFDGVKEGDSIKLMGSTLNVIGRDADNRLKLKDSSTGIEILLDKENWEKLGIKSKSVEKPKEEKKAKEEKVAKKESLEDIGTLVKNAPTMSKEDLKKNFPNLTETGGSYDGALIVKNLRTLLKEKFPDVKFSVRKDGSNAWVTFPRETSDEVGNMIRKVADLFETSDYHPYEDYWGVKSTNFTKMFGGLSYIISQRES